MSNLLPKNKISIIGCGKVGMTTAYTLIIKNLAKELVLLSRDIDKIAGEKLDLEHGSNFTGSTKIVATDNYRDVSNSDIVIITAGVAQKKGETRLDLVKNNTTLIEEIVPQIVEFAPNAILLLVSNPVDVLTYRAAEIANLPKGKVFGTGTTLDTARFRFHLSELIGANPRSIHAYVLGEHGDSSFPVLSSSSIGGQKLLDLPGLTKAKAIEAYEKTKNSAYEIIEAKGATYYAISVIISKIVETILKDNKSILPVSIPLEDFYGHSGVALSVPCLIGKNGVERVIEPALDEVELKSLEHSVRTLKEFL